MGGTVTRRADGLDSGLERRSVRFGGVRLAYTGDGKASARVNLPQSRSTSLGRRLRNGLRGANPAAFGKKVRLLTQDWGKSGGKKGVDFHGLAPSNLVG